MKFLIFIVTDQSVAHIEEPPGAIQAWVKEGAERGIRLDGNRLRPPEGAKLVRVREGLSRTDRSSRPKNGSQAMTFSNVGT